MNLYDKKLILKTYDMNDYDHFLAKDKDETWSVTFAQKKAMYGSSNRVPVGGRPADEVSDAQKGTQADITLHSYFCSTSL